MLCKARDVRAHHYEIERDAKQIHDHAAVGVGKILGPQGADQWEVHTNTNLEEKKRYDERHESSATARSGRCH